METLRERKKQRTRDALVRAAVDLFVSQGYAHTTVDDIAAAVDVSQRTFFRYFAGKEEAALALQDMVIARFMASVRERPPHETPLEAMRQAVMEGWDTIHEIIESVVPVEQYLRMYHVIESSPVLLAAHLRRSVEVEEGLAQVLAEREGVDLDTDPHPRLTVAVFSGVMRVTERQWIMAGDISLEAMRAMTIANLELVGPTLAENWRTN